MDARLRAIDDAYRSLVAQEHTTDDDHKMRRARTDRYTQTHEAFWQIAGSLTCADVIESYEQASGPLQQSLIGLIWHWHSNSVAISDPCLSFARHIIQLDDHQENNFLVLMLSKYSHKVPLDTILPAAVSSKHHGVREAAMWAIRDARPPSAAYWLQKLTEDTLPFIAENAREILSDLTP